MAISVLGLLAAAGAPLVMTCGFLLWDQLWTGSAIMLNLFKCSLASCGFVLAVGIFALFSSAPFVNDDLFSDGAEVYNMLLLSSVIGIVIGDVLWLVGLLLLGTRRCIIVDMLKPFLAAAAGALFLEQRMSTLAIVGVVVTTLGVLLVSLEREAPPAGKPSDSEQSVEPCGVADDTLPEKLAGDGQKEAAAPCDVVVLGGGEEIPAENIPAKKPVLEGGAAVVAEDVAREAGKGASPLLWCSSSLLRGYAAAFTNVVLDVGGSVLTRAYGSNLTTWDINLVRFGSAAVILVLGAICGRLGVKAASRLTGTQRSAPTWLCFPSAEAMDRRAWMYVSCGVLLVTFLCPAMSQYALFELELGISITLNSIGPLYALPLTWLLKKERVSVRACLGVLLACGGIPLLAFGG